MGATRDLIDELSWRGLLHQCTDEPALREHLKQPRRIYVGFDPTADSLTIGNLVPIMMLVHAQRCGHTPVVVMGGGTGLIGDPSGKEAERQLQTREKVLENVESQRRIFDALLAGEGANASKITNNLDWLEKLSFLEALRDVGKHFSVNSMIQKDSVRTRLESRDQGISFTEFTYQILQAYDFAHLFRAEGVSVQMGGSDQWGNIVGGVDLVRRIEQKEAYGLTAPLVTKADGGKFGKTESGAVWLTRERTSPYAYFQFWLNADDRDLGRFLRTFTLLSKDEIESLEAQHAEKPGARIAHRALAVEATTLLHGRDEAQRADDASRALFSGQVAGLDLATLSEVFAEVPSTDFPRARLDELGADVPQLLVETELARSKREAREFLSSGSVSVNGEKIDAESPITAAHLLHDSVILLRRGKKNWHVTRWS